MLGKCASTRSLQSSPPESRGRYRGHDGGVGVAAAVGQYFLFLIKDYTSKVVGWYSVFLL